MPDVDFKTAGSQGTNSKESVQSSFSYLEGIDFLAFQDLSIYIFLYVIKILYT